MIATGKNTVLWIKEETAGAPAWPAASDAVLVTAAPTFKQERVFLEDPQKRNTRGKLGRVAGVYKAGELSFTTPVKPSGSAGSEPVPSQVLKALMGKESVTASTKVEYTLYETDDAVRTLSVLVRNGFNTILYTGCYINQGTFTVKSGEGDDAIQSGQFSGGFLRQYRAGTDALNAAVDGTVTPVTVIPLKNSGAFKKYDAGTKIRIGSDDNSGSGFEVTGIDSAANTLTITPGLASSQAADALVEGWTPEVTEAGHLIHGRFGKYQEKLDGEDYQDCLITEATVEINNNFKVLNEEKTDSAFPESIVSGKRDVSFKTSRYFRADGSTYEYDANNQIVRSVKLPAGVDAGKRVRFELPNICINSPEISGDEEMTIALSGTAYESAALNDSVKIIFD